MIISGGEDSIVQCWNIFDILNTENKKIKSIHSWSEHTLPISDMAIGSSGIQSRLITVSSDRTCRIYDLISKSQLCCLLFPVGLTCVAFEISERFFYVGGLDGKIYPVTLNKIQHFTANEITNQSEREINQPLIGHKQQITCMCISIDGNFLVSGSSDGIIIVWECKSRQVMRQFTNHKGSISGIKILFKPFDLYDISEKKNDYFPLESFKKQTNEILNQSISMTYYHEFEDNTNIKQNNDFTQEPKSTDVSQEVDKLKNEKRDLLIQNAKWSQLNEQLFEFSFQNITNNK